MRDDQVGAADPGNPGDAREAEEPPAGTQARTPSPSEPWLGAWEALVVRIGAAEAPGSRFAATFPETLDEIRHSPDPELAFNAWQRWIESDGMPAGVSISASVGTEPSSSESPRDRWAVSQEFRRGFIALAGISPALGNLLLTLWRDFRPDDWQGGWTTRGQFSRRIALSLEGLDDKEFVDAARRFQRLESLRIAYLDCVQGLPVEQVTLQISGLADALVSVCRERALRIVSRRQGKVPPQGGFVIFALGKLGGGELNYSSDIDLNFVYDDAWPGLETVDGRLVEDPREVERFFTLVAERFVQLVNSFADLGQLYRLDTRLRPQGSSGRLVWSARASVDYYYSQGRAWERQALIRLRAISGDLELAARFRAELESFIFPASFSAQEIAEIRGLKLQMEKMAADRGASDAHIKIGRGGIRDVEYIVQYLQLVHGARIPALKTANIFQALEVLEAAGLLKAEETDVLRRGYRFLRRVEHRIQMAELRQTHVLPEHPRDRARLARGMGFPGTEAFIAQLERTSDDIRRVYRLLFEDATTPKDESHELPALLDIPFDLAEAEGAKLLAPFGFAQPERAFARIHGLANAGDERLRLDAQRSKQTFANLLGRLLRELSLAAEPDRTLANFEACVKSLGARSVFFQLLDESPRILQLFVEICARSTLLVDLLRTHPDIFDEVVDALLTGYRFDLDSLIELTRGFARNTAEATEALFKFKHFHFLLVALHDLERIDNLSNTLYKVSALAEAILNALVERTLEETTARHGAWSGAAPRFLILGLGKLGGQEMGYRSDLDLVIIHEGGASTTEGVSASEYFERFAQALLHACATADSTGPLLRIDLRLRPLGSHNSLAIAGDAWRSYFQTGEARTWERQAFLRARPIAGDPELGKEVLAFIHRELVLGGSAGPASREAALRDILEMRSKIEQHGGPKDLKKGVGGIVDVEFLVQALQLCNGLAHPSILVQNTPAAIHALMEVGLLPASGGSELLTAYQFLRSVENRLALIGEGGHSFEGMAARDQESLVQRIGYKSTGEESAWSIFQGELLYHRRRNRHHLESILKPGS